MTFLFLGYMFRTLRVFVCGHGALFHSPIFVICFVAAPVHLHCTTAGATNVSSMVQRENGNANVVISFLLPLYIFTAQAARA